MLGVDPALYEDFHAWSDEVVQVGFNPFPTEEQKRAAAAAQQALEELFRIEIARRGDGSGVFLSNSIVSLKQNRRIIFWNIPFLKAAKNKLLPM